MLFALSRTVSRLVVSLPALGVLQALSRLSCIPRERESYLVFDV